MEQKITSHIIKGLIVAAILIVVNVVGQITGAIYNDNYRWIGTIIYVASIVVSAIYFSNQNNQNVNFGILFTHSFKTATVITSILFLYTLVSVYFIFPGQIDHFVNIGINEAKKQGKSAAEIQEGIVMAKKVLIISFLAGGLMINLITGALGAFLGAAIAKKNPNFQPTQK
ncbi:MAG: DUF4199 domain-containing protein [Bacteroidota bacterium]|nr:DUF4199 domain-containing protein [Bacteroidota bacterium]